MKSSTRQFWQAFIALSVALSAVAIYQAEQQTQALLKIRFRYKWALVIVVFAINLGAGVYWLWRDRQDDSLWQKLEVQGGNIMWRVAGSVLLIVSIPLLWYAKFYFFGKALPSFFPLLWVWLWLTLVQALGIKMLARFSWVRSFGSALLLGGIIFQSYFFLQPVTEYPFSLGWSEASRFYYGSLPFSESVYGVRLPLSVWHGSRYFLLSIPFLFSEPSLWAARLWQALLWIGLSGLTAFFLVRRLKLDDAVMKLLIGGWFAFFLLQGAVYYHLLICVMIIFAGVSRGNNLRSLFAIILASFWAGMSRVNWFPVPAMLAITIYLLERPFSTKTGNFWQYIQIPVLWSAAGLLFAFAGQFVYIAVSGIQDLSAFGSSFTSALLWYRWWPSDTNPLGVIPAVVLISFPPFLLLLQILRGRWNSLHPTRWFGIFSMLGVLLTGGLVVSTKIGGGGDLHNMDAYIVLAGLITAYFLSDMVETESLPLPAIGMGQPLFITFLLIVPVVFSLSRVVFPVRYDRGQASRDLIALREVVQSYGAKGEVLFIYERHLLTFDMIPNVPIVPEYEVITLTEMAISGNQPYLERFTDDLQEHRFTAIVARKQNMDASTGDFAEESNVWNQLVAYPLLCEYEPVLTLDSSNIQVFVPRDAPECPEVTFK